MSGHGFDITDDSLIVVLRHVVAATVVRRHVVIAAVVSRLVQVHVPERHSRRSSLVGRDGQVGGGHLFDRQYLCWFLDLLVVYKHFQVIYRALAPT